MKKLFLIFCLLTCITASAQLAKDPEYIKYDWVSKPKLHTITDKEKELPDLVLKEKQAIEFVYNSTGELEEYELFHKIIKVNNNEGIEQNNKIYIPSSSQIQFSYLKSRVISSSGNVKELAQKDIKEAIDEKSKQQFKYFAMDGIDAGSEIEILYLAKSAPNYTGSCQRVQNNNLKKDIEWQIISPKNLTFAVKSFNGLPEFKKDTSLADKNTLVLKLDKMPLMEEEDVSCYYANVQQFVYKLKDNTATGAKNVITYGQVSNNIYKAAMAPAEKSVAKKVSKLVSSINIKYAKDDEDKIRTIEQYIKTRFAIVESGNAQTGEIEFVIDNKMGNEQGMVKLFSAILNQLQIDYQLVLTSKRDLLKFDPEFECFNYLNDYLIYIPSINKYLAPGDQISSLGFPPYYLTNTYGLFIKKVSLGEYSSGVGKVQFIEPLPSEMSYSNHLVTVEFDKEPLNSVVKLEQHMGGYYAQYYQPYYSYLNDEQKKNLTDELFRQFSSGEILKSSIENEGKDYFGIKPFIIKADFKIESLVEKAGNNYLFKIGDLIGPQMEMYKKVERVTPVENTFNRSYHREISFNIPEGYQIANPQVLKMDFAVVENGQKVASFWSDYKIEGNTVKVIVDEYYKKIVFPVSQFEDYRRVINAAADFNKISIVLKSTK